MSPVRSASAVLAVRAASRAFRRVMKKFPRSFSTAAVSAGVPPSRQVERPLEGGLGGVGRAGRDQDVAETRQDPRHLRPVLRGLRQLQRAIEHPDGLPVPSERGVCLARVHQRLDLAGSVAGPLGGDRGKGPALDRAVEVPSFECGAPGCHVPLGGVLLS
jgi:hypothetical protein